jgi:hypothetical protein
MNLHGGANVAVAFVNALVAPLPVLLTRMPFGVLVT